jgi:CheY-like chemotaxis protein
MVYGFVKQSGGHIKIYSEAGEGTTIRMYLPRTREQEDVIMDAEAVQPTGGTETVLVVEDDEDVRATVVEMLTDLGYRVLKAKDADSALAIVESGVPIDLLFTDVVMPGTLRSPELARKTRERLPQVAVLFTSGYTQNAIVHGGKLDDGVDLLSKPYSREDLARKIRYVMRNQQQRNLSVPLVMPNLPTGAGAEAAGIDPPRGQRILLVEDEALIRLATADMLSDMGHSVLEAGSAKDALEILESEKVDVLLTDFTLPGMTGGELAREAISRFPGLKIVFASGHDLRSSTSDLPVDAGHLVKPYTEERLAEALTTVMRKGKAAPSAER